MSRTCPGTAAHDKKMLLLLQNSHNRIFKELKTAEKRHHEIANDIGASEEIVYQLKSLDELKVEVPKLKAGNTRMNVILTALSRKTAALQEALIDLRKARDEVQTALSEKTDKRNEVARLRSKIMPRAELNELKARLDNNLSGLKRVSDELNRLKTEVPRLIENRNALKTELDQKEIRIPHTRNRITAMKQRFEQLTPKVVSERARADLEEAVRSLKLRKETLAEEIKEISPRIDAITGEEGKLTEILDAYQEKNNKDAAVLSGLEESVKEQGISKEKVDALRQQVVSLENGHAARKDEMERLKKDYAALLDANQSYKAIIKEVDEGTEQLKKMMDNQG